MLISYLYSNWDVLVSGNSKAIGKRVKEGFLPRQSASRHKRFPYVILDVPQDYVKKCKRSPRIV
jgi:hypothetical protein